MKHTLKNNDYKLRVQFASLIKAVEDKTTPPNKLKWEVQKFIKELNKRLNGRGL